MVVTVVWMVLLAVGLVWEGYCHVRGGRWISLHRIGVAISHYRYGRLILLVAWAFIGWHLFARDSLPH